ncbi:MAG: hypothetical protein KUG82_05125 [Pseudomonadales bacterium]|nr:hypothetical protein [Pseudomonadales bacterium]
MSNETLPEHLLAACDELDRLKNPKWAYTIITHDQQQETEVHFDPSKLIEEQYTLFSVNGRSPRRAELKTFKTKKAKSRKGGETGLTIKSMPNPKTMIRPGSLKLLGENEETIRYSFKPVLDMPVARNVMPKLEGEIQYCKNHQILEQIKIINVQVFTPLPTFKVEALLGVAVFARLPEGNLQLVETEMELKGKKFFVGSLDQTVRTSYLNHVQVIFDD